jgi:hypothetical protein
MRNKYTDEKIIGAVKISRSFNEVLKTLGGGKSGSVYMHIKKRILNIGADISHFNPHWNKKNRGGKNKKTLSEILILRKDGNREKSERLKNSLIKSGVEYKCNICGIKEWCGKNIVLHVDHKNGINYDNRIFNLRFLCPNCHSQTKNFGFRKSVPSGK